MNSLKKLFNLVNKAKATEDIKEVTEFLKKNEQFKKIALDIHEKKSSFRSSFMKSLDNILEHEDGLNKEKKQITDDSINNKNKK